MQREIKFRAKRLDNKQWAYGNLLLDEPIGLAWIVDGAYNALYPKDDVQNLFRVDPETVGQYVGRKDKNGSEVYEGDIDKRMGVVEYVTDINWDGGGVIEHPGFYFSKAKAYEQFDDNRELTYYSGFENCKIIGNTVDNPELIP